MDSSSPQTTSTLSGPQKKVARRLSSEFLQGIDQGATPFTGDRVATLVPGISRFQGILDQIPIDLSAQQEAEGALKRLLSGEPAYDLSPQRTASYFQSAVTDPMLRTFDEEIAPRINDAFAGQGGTFSTRRGLAHRRALEGLQTDLASQLGQAQLSNQQLAAQLSDSAANRSLAAAGATGDILANPARTASLYAQAYSPFQNFEQALLDTQYQEFQRTAPENNPYYQLGLAFTGQNQAASYVQPNPLGGILGSAAGLGLLGASMFTPAAPVTAGAGIGSGAIGAVNWINNLIPR